MSLIAIKEYLTKEFGGHWHERYAPGYSAFDLHAKANADDFVNNNHLHGTMEAYSGLYVTGMSPEMTGAVSKLITAAGIEHTVNDQGQLELSLKAIEALRTATFRMKHKGRNLGSFDTLAAKAASDANVDLPRGAQRY